MVFKKILSLVVEKSKSKSLLAAMKLLTYSENHFSNPLQRPLTAAILTLKALSMQTHSSPLLSSQWTGRTTLHRKKRFASFPSPAGMSLPNSPCAGIMTSQLNYSCTGGVWLVTSRLKSGNSWTFFLRCIVICSQSPLSDLQFCTEHLSRTVRQRVKLPADFEHSLPAL